LKIRNRFLFWKLSSLLVCNYSKNSSSFYLNKILWLIIVLHQNSCWISKTLSLITSLNLIYNCWLLVFTQFIFHIYTNRIFSLRIIDEIFDVSLNKILSSSPSDMSPLLRETQLPSHQTQNLKCTSMKYLWIIFRFYTLDLWLRRCTPFQSTQFEISFSYH